MNDKTLVFLPTFNDFTELQGLLSDIKKHLPDCDILIVDDGSYNEYKPPQDVFYVRIPFNLGLGVATHIAMDFAQQNNYAYLIRLDADGQHGTDQLSEFLSRLKQDAGETDIVIGTRLNRHDSAGIKNFMKKIIHNYFYYLARFTTSKNIPTDLNSGYLGFNSKAMRIINSLDLERYPEPQIVLFGAEKGLNFSDIPIKQKPRKHGTSTLAYLQTLRLIYRFTMYNFILLIRRPLI